MERRRAEREGGAPDTLQEIDFLLQVDDEARQGALRFSEREGGPFLREEGVKRIPPLVELPKLLSAAEHVMEDKGGARRSERLHRELLDRPFCLGHGGPAGRFGRPQDDPVACSSKRKICRNAFA